jgi:hypothetical protein
MDGTLGHVYILLFMCLCYSYSFMFLLLFILYSFGCMVIQITYACIYPIIFVSAINLIHFIPNPRSDISVFKSASDYYLIHSESNKKTW